MKTIAITLSLLLAGVVSVRAQSNASTESNAGRQGSSSVNYGRKANSSQTVGKGVPYAKNKEQQRRLEAKGGTPSSAGSGSSTSGQGSKKSNAKPKSTSSGSGNSQ